jgi:hypothetical protein
MNNINYLNKITSVQSNNNLSQQIKDVKTKENQLSLAREKIGDFKEEMFSSEAEAPKKEKKAGFTDEIRKNFKKWDLDEDGIISDDDLSELIKNPQIKGEDAANLATLNIFRFRIRVLNNDDKSGGISLEDLDAYDEKRKTNVMMGITLAIQKAAHMNKIDNQSRELFPQNFPDPLKVKQGGLGDCYFISAVSSKASQDPQSIKNMISANDDGTYSVKLPGRDEIKINSPTDTEIALFSGAGDNGLWLSLLEKAYAESENNSSWFFKKDIPQDAIGNDGYLKEGIRAITGNDADVDITFFTTYDTTRNKLEDAMNKKAVITAGIYEGFLEEDKSNEGLAGDHAYTILNYDREKDEVTVRNPWGHTDFADSVFRYHDYNNDGTFKMSLEKFDKYFSIIAYEEKE